MALSPESEKLSSSSPSSHTGVNTDNENSSDTGTGRLTDTGRLTCGGGLNAVLSHTIVNADTDTDTDKTYLWW